MDSRKNDKDRAINLLKLYKSKLNKPDEKALRRAMDKLIEALQSQLYNALLDIQELYEMTLCDVSNIEQPSLPPMQPPPSLPPLPPLPPLEPIKSTVVEVQRTEKSKPKREKSKKSKKDRKSQDAEDEEDGRGINVQYQAALPVPDEYRYEEPQNVLEPSVDPDLEHLDDDQNPWVFFEILLNKGKKGYGFAVAGGVDKNHYEGDDGIFVTKVIPGGAAEVDGQLRIDDVIVSVNETNLDYVTHSTAVDTLKNVGNNMTLIIRRLRDDYYANDSEPPAEEYMEKANEQPPMEMFSPQRPHHDPEEELLSDDGQFYQFEIVLTKRQGSGLGFSIQGGYDADNPSEDCYISVSKLTPGGIAETDGRLEVNDILLMVDDRSLNGLSHDECVNLLKNTGRVVKLFVGRFAEVLQPDEVVVEKAAQREERVSDKAEKKKKKKKHRRDHNDD